MSPTKEIQFSIIIAVYQRKDELTELLKSLTLQTCKNFEVIIVDDGSPDKLENIAFNFSKELNLHYYYKNNTGPGLSRNFGMSKASGNYFIFLDSDTIIPPQYICEVQQELRQDYVDFFGGSDSAHQSFDVLQKAINFSMTSFLTTGGVRGGKKAVKNFQPRSFNMGISKEAFQKTEGFSDLRIGEDPDLTMRLWENGFKSRWFPKAFVFHKRRTSLSKFFNQVKEFGIARPILNQRHPTYTAITFWFPSLFLIGLLCSILIALIGMSIFLMFYLVYFLLIFILSSLQNKSIGVGGWSVITSFLQFTGYGFGFLLSQIKLNVLKQSPKQAFPTHFYKETTYD